MTEEEITEEETNSTGVAIINAAKAAIEGLTDNFVTFLVVIGFMYMLIIGREIPDILQTIIGMIFAYYYTAK